MKIIKPGIIIFIIILMLAGCDLAHEQHGNEHDDGHDHGAVENDRTQDTAENNSGHNDAFGGLELGTEEEQPAGKIIFSLEQQQLVDFATVAATKREMSSSLKATGVIQAASYGQTIVTAPVSGYLAILETPFPRFGDTVAAGDIMAKIVPSLNGDTDPATLDLEVRRSRSNHQLAGKKLIRLEALFEQGVVPERRVQEARKEEQVAKAELVSAEQRLKQYRSPTEKNNGANALKVTSPINGILDGVYVTPGAYLQEGDALFHVVNTKTLRLEARIPEADIARLMNPRGAWFTVDGFDSPFQIDLARGDRLIALGSVVDSQTRTVPLVFEFPNIDNKLRIGMFARVNVITGVTREAVAIPATAAQEYGGLAVVYVQSHSDAFERRVVDLGIRDGDFVEVKSGINPGEKVVTRGSYLIQLAASGPQEAGHGHAH